MAKYGSKVKQWVRKEIDKYKQKNRWKNRKQAIAVGLSEARKNGVKVPKKK